MASVHTLTLPALQTDKSVLHAVLDTEDRLTEVREVLSALEILQGAIQARIDHGTIGDGLAVAHSQLAAILGRLDASFDRLYALTKEQPEAAGADDAIFAAWEAYKALARDLEAAETSDDHELEARFYAPMDTLSNFINQTRAVTPAGMAIKGRLALRVWGADAETQAIAFGNETPAPEDLNELPEEVARGLWRMILDAEAMPEGRAA